MTLTLDIKMVSLYEKEHNYARPWYKKINSNQKYPCRITKFIFLKNFPRHYLSKYPSSYNLDGTLDVGSPEDLHQNVVDIHPTNEQEKHEEKTEVLDTSMWTQQMDRLYYNILRILEQHHLTKLVYQNLPHGPIRMAALMENTALQLRHSFANIAGWDNQLLIWLHNLFIQKLPSHEHLIDTYHEVMQYLTKRLPCLIEKFYSADQMVPTNYEITTPVTSVRRLLSSPIILWVPNGPGQATSARNEYWKSLLSAMGQLINVNVYYRPEQRATDILHIIKASVQDKIREARKKKRPLILVGFNEASLIAIKCALENQGLVSLIICLGFPLSSINGFRGDLDDPMLDLNIPVLFVVGLMASTTTLDGLERLRESMSRCDTGLIVVGGANDKLIVSYKKKMQEGITQYHVDKKIADEIYEFINSINLKLNL